MHIVIVAPPDRRRLTAAVRYVSRWMFRAYYVMGAAGVLLGLLFAVVPPSDPLLDAPLVALGLVLLAYPSVALAVMRRQQRKFETMTIEYEIGDDGIVTRHPHGESTLRWPVLERAALIPDDLLVLWVTKRQYFPVPIGALSAEHRAQLRDLLERRGLLRRSRPDLWTTSGPAPR